MAQWWETPAPSLNPPDPVPHPASNGLDDLAPMMPGAQDNPYLRSALSAYQQMRDQSRALLAAPVPASAAPPVEPPKPEEGWISKIGGTILTPIAETLTQVGPALYNVADAATGGYLDEGLRRLQAGAQNLLGDDVRWQDIPTMAEGAAHNKALLTPYESQGLQAGRQQLSQAQGVGESLKTVATNPYLLTGMVAESLPWMIGIAGPAKAAATAAFEGAMAKGATQAVAEAAAKTAATRASIAGNFAISGGTSGLSAQERIYGMSEAELANSPAYQQLRQQGFDHRAAQEALARSANVKTTAVAGTLGAGATALLGGGLESQIAQRLAGVAGPSQGVVKNILGGAARESGEEYLQSGGERLGENVGLQAVNPTTPLLNHVFEDAAVGALVGAVAGGTFGALGDTDRTRQGRAGQDATHRADLARLALAHLDEPRLAAAAEQARKALADNPKMPARQRQALESAIGHLDTDLQGRANGEGLRQVLADPAQLQTLRGQATLAGMADDARVGQLSDEELLTAAEQAVQMAQTPALGQGLQQQFTEVAQAYAGHLKARQQLANLDAALQADPTIAPSLAARITQAATGQPKKGITPEYSRASLDDTELTRHLTAAERLLGQHGGRLNEDQRASLTEARAALQAEREQRAANPDWQARNAQIMQANDPREVRLRQAFAKNPEKTVARLTANDAPLIDTLIQSFESRAQNYAQTGYPIPESITRPLNLLQARKTALETDATQKQQAAEAKRQADYLRQQKSPVPTLADALDLTPTNADPLGDWLQQRADIADEQGQMLKRAIAALQSPPTNPEQQRRAEEGRRLIAARLEGELLQQGIEEQAARAQAQAAVDDWIGSGGQSGQSRVIGQLGQPLGDPRVQQGRQELSRLLGPAPAPQAAPATPISQPQSLADFLNRDSTAGNVPSAPGRAEGPMATPAPPAPRARPKMTQAEIKAMQGKSAVPTPAQSPTDFPPVTKLATLSEAELDALQTRFSAWLDQHGDENSWVQMPDGSRAQTIVRIREMKTVRDYQRALEDASIQAYRNRPAPPPPPSRPADPRQAEREAQLEKKRKDREAQIDALRQPIQARLAAIRQQARARKAAGEDPQTISKALSPLLREGKQHLDWLEQRAFEATDGKGRSVNHRAAGAQWTAIPESLRAFAEEKTPAPKSAPQPQPETAREKGQAQTPPVLNAAAKGAGVKKEPSKKAQPEKKTAVPPAAVPPAVPVHTTPEGQTEPVTLAVVQEALQESIPNRVSAQEKAKTIAAHIGDVLQKIDAAIKTAFVDHGALRKELGKAKAKDALEHQQRQLVREAKAEQGQIAAQLVKGLNDLQKEYGTRLHSAQQVAKRQKGESPDAKLQATFHAVDSLWQQAKAARTDAERWALYQSQATAIEEVLSETSSYISSYLAEPLRTAISRWKGTQKALQEIENQLPTAHDTIKTIVSIHVPGDGVFTVPNTVPALQKLRALIAKSTVFKKGALPDSRSKPQSFSTKPDPASDAILALVREKEGDHAENVANAWNLALARDVTVIVSPTGSGKTDFAGKDWQAYLRQNAPLLYVNAQPVDVARYPALAGNGVFVVAQRNTSDQGKGWDVIHADTGTLVAQGEKTPESALAALERLLKEKAITAEKMRSAIQERITALAEGLGVPATAADVKAGIEARMEAWVEQVQNPKPETRPEPKAPEPETPQSLAEQATAIIDRALTSIESAGPGSALIPRIEEATLANIAHLQEKGLSADEVARFQESFRNEARKRTAPEPAPVAQPKAAPATPAQAHPKAASSPASKAPKANYADANALRQARKDGQIDTPTLIQGLAQQVVSGKIPIGKLFGNLQAFDDWSEGDVATALREAGMAPAKLKELGYEQKFAAASLPAAVTDALKALSGNATVQALIDGGTLRVVAKQSALPSRIVIPSGQRIAGAVDPETGVVYLIAENIAPGEIEGFLAHEVGVHQAQLGLNQPKSRALRLAHALTRLVGARQILGEPSFNDALAQLQRMRATSKPVQAAYAAAQQAMGHLNQNPALLHEEALAYLVQNHPKTSLAQQIIAAVRAFLYKAGLKINLTENDLQALAVAALRGRAGTKPASSAREVALQRAAQAQQDQGALVVRNPTQIKSAMGNTGAFSPDNADIRYAYVLGQAEPNLTAEEVLQRIEAGGEVTAEEFALLQAYLSGASRAVPASGVDAPSFKNWFGNSKIKGRNGQPLKMYHGTSADFTVFEAATSGTSTSHPTAALGFFFTNDRAHAAEKYGDRVMEVYLAVEKPYLMTDADLRRMDTFEDARALRRKLEAQGYDGVVMPAETKTRYVVAFRPDQIKFTTNETYTRGENDIRFAKTSERAMTTGILSKDYKSAFSWERNDDGSFRVDYLESDSEIARKRNTKLGWAKFSKNGELIATGTDWLSKPSRNSLDLAQIEVNHLVNIWKSPLKSFYFRFGDLPKDLKSKHAISGKKEKGVSVYTATPNVWGIYALDDSIKFPFYGMALLDRPAYEISGKVVGYGADGEPLLKDAKIVREIGIKEIKSLMRIQEDNTNKISDTRFAIATPNPRPLTPAQQAAMDKIGRREPQGWGVRFAGLRDRIGLKLRQAIADHHAALLDLDRQAYGEGVVENQTAAASWVKARLSRSVDGPMHLLLHESGLRIDADGALDVLPTVKGLQKVLAPLGTEVDDFLKWVAGNRAERLMQEGRENLFTPTDITALKTLNQGTMADGRNRATVYASVLKDFVALQKSVMDIAEQSGLIDGNERHVWEHDFYVPFYRLAEDTQDVRSINAGDGLVRQEAFKKLKGGKDRLNDLLENTVMNWQHLLSASLKNNAARQALTNAQRVRYGGIPVAEPINPAKESTKGAVYYRQNGQPQWFRVNDPLVLEAITALDFNGLKGPVMSLLRKARHLLTRTTTISPAFKVANLLRDTVQTLAVSQASAKTGGLGNIVQGWKNYAADSAIRQQMLAGSGAFLFGSTLEDHAEAMKKLLAKGVRPATILDTPAKLWEVLSLAYWKYEAFGDRLENANRAALYEQLRKQGKSHLYASFQARDLLDFSQSGASGAVRFLTAVVPFLNARIQGLDKLGRAASQSAQRGRFAVTLAAVTLASAALYLLYKDDDDFKQREEWDRDTYWWFKIGDTVFRIPKPFEVGALATLLGDRIMEQIFDREATPALYLDRLKQTLTQTFSVSMPQLFAPAVDVWRNRGSFTQRPIETLAQQRLSPELRQTASTSDVARGVSAASQGFLSPVQADYLIAGYFGWVGRQAVLMADHATRPLTDRPSPERLPVISDLMQRFVPTEQGGHSKYLTRFYEVAKTTEQHYADINELVKRGEIDAAKALVQRHREDLTRLKLYRKASTQLNDWNNQLKLLADLPASQISTDQRQRARETLQAAKLRLAQAVMAGQPAR